jgi:polyisoprenoid-binding protein YceI
MEFRARILWILLLVALASVVQPAVAGQRIVLDPEASSISFVLDATLHKVHGVLKIKRSEIEFGNSYALGEIVLDAGLTTTGNGKRDRKMHAEVLLSEAWPEITFRPVKFQGSVPAQGRAELVLRGAFHILGQVHRTEVPVALEIDDDRIRVESEFTIPYVEWGLKDPSVFVLRVAKVVQVSVTLAGRLETVE